MAAIAVSVSAMAETNPFLDYKNWKTPHGTYPFNEIRPEHYMPASFGKLIIEPSRQIIYTQHNTCSHLIRPQEN